PRSRFAPGRALNWNGALSRPPAQSRKTAWQLVQLEYSLVNAALVASGFWSLTAVLSSWALFFISSVNLVQSLGSFIGSFFFGVYWWVSSAMAMVISARRMK